MSDLPLDDWLAVQVSDAPRAIWQLGQVPTHREWAALKCQQRHFGKGLWLCLDTEFLWIYQSSLQQHWLTRLTLKSQPTAPKNTNYWLGDALLTERSEQLRLQLFQTQWSAKQILAQVQFRYHQRLISQPLSGYQQMTIKLQEPSEYWFIQEQATGANVVRVSYAD